MLHTNQSMDPQCYIQIKQWIPNATYKSIDGSPTLHTNQSTYKSIDGYISIDGSPTLHTNQSMDTCQLTDPQARNKSTDGSPLLHTNQLIDI